MSLILIQDADMPQGCCWADENRKWHLCFYHDQCKVIHKLMREGKVMIGGRAKGCPMTEVRHFGIVHGAAQIKEGTNNNPIGSPIGQIYTDLKENDISRFVQVQLEL